MRASLFCMIVLGITSVYGQKKSGDLINASFENEQLEVIFDTLSSQTGYFFSYNSELLPQGSKYTISAQNQPIDQFLSRLLVGTGLKYSFFKDQIILNYEPPEDRVVRRKNFFTISGTVYDEEGKPLRNVNIFLDGTTIGASSDIDGNYHLESIPPGRYDIVFSHVGYENAVYPLIENNGGARIQNHKMHLDLGQLEEVEVVSERIGNSESEWETYYKIFRDELLGKSRNSLQCVIENPETLNFTYNEQTATLKAYAKEEIKIRNDALGYTISYFLETFKKEGSDLRFRGRIRFRNSLSLSSKERRGWKKARKMAYLGSFNHFKRSLLKGELRKEGFRIYQLNNLQKFEIEKENELTEDDIIVFKGDHYELDFKKYLVVEYRKESESKEFLINSDFVEFLYSDFISNYGVLMKAPGSQISVIKLLRNSVRIDLSGEVLDRFGLTSYGYWSWERVADLVPINYDPKYDKL